MADIPIRQFACIADYVRSFMLTQKCRPRISEFGPKFACQLKRQIKFVLSVCVCVCGGGGGGGVQGKLQNFTVLRHILL